MQRIFHGTNIPQTLITDAVNNTINYNKISTTADNNDATKYIKSADLSDIIWILVSGRILKCNLIHFISRLHSIPGSINTPS